MKILYTSYLCSQSYFQELFDSAISKPAQAPQKFNHLMVVGLMKNGAEVTCLCGRPITMRSHKRFLWRGCEEIIDNIKYIYIPCVNNPVFKYFIYFWYAFFYTLIWSLKNYKEGTVVTDILCDPITKGSALAARIAGIPVNGIVTDLPNMLDFDFKKKNIIKIVNNALSLNPFKLCTQFTPLTEQMCDVINKKNKPYVVVEGLVDSDMKSVERIPASDGKRHICYTGQIYEQFGVKNLIEAFMKVEATDAVLDIYGPGPLAEIMPQYMANDSRIVYHGCVPMSEAIRAQLSAFLLVNPRPTHEEFVKYSFPSKNVEYMVSGTPMLTTILPGMPKDYQEHVFLFSDETVDGMAKTLNYIMSLSKQEVIAKGKDGKEFVLKYKNNVVQSKKIIDLLYG